MRRSGLTGRIVIVDDDASLRGAVAGLLRSAGYAVRAFAAGEHVLADGETRDADCIVADVQMPGLDGIDLIRELRASGSTVPVILMTARTEAALLDRALASGALCLLRKPFEADGLIACVRAAMSDDCSAPNEMR